MNSQNQKGFSFISLLAVLVIAGLIYYGYFQMQSGIAPGPVATAAKSAVQVTACRMNRQALERSIMTWTTSHPGSQPTLEELKKSRIPILPCPEGGQFTIRGGKVFCSIHDAPR